MMCFNIIGISIKKRIFTKRIYASVGDDLLTLVATFSFSITIVLVSFLLIKFDYEAFDD